MSIGPLEWLVANGAVCILIVLVLGGWARARPQVRPHVVGGVVCVALAGCVLPLLFSPADVPLGWITPLQEGRSFRDIRQLYGQTAHAGAGFSTLIDWLSAHAVTSLPAVVRVNICVAVVNAILFFFVASFVLDSWWASLVFALYYAGNLNTLHAAVSETPAAVWSTHFWLGCIAAAVIDDQAHATPRLRRLALVLLVALAWLAALLRSELLLLGGPAVVVAVAKELGWEAEMRRAVRGAGRLVRSIVAGRLSIFVLATAALLAMRFLPRMGPVSYAIDGIAPLNLSFLLMPQKLGVFLPVGLIVLFVLGLVHSTRRWVSFVLLPITLLTLFKTYASATQGAFEAFRYLTFLTPAVFFLALFGFRELCDWAQRWAWPSWWKRPALLLLGLSMLAWQPFGPRETFGRRHHVPGLTSPEPLLGRNLQTEVRYVLDLVRRYPSCVFLVKAQRDESRLDGPPRYRWGAFGAPVREFKEMLDTGESPEQVAANLVPGAACVLFYRSLDCDLVDSDGCQAETHGRVALEERVVGDLPYSDISEYGEHRAEIHLGVFPIGPPPTRDSQS